MGKLQIRKKATAIWEHILEDDGTNTILSNFTFRIYQESIEITELSGVDAFRKPISDVEVYDDTVGGSIEVFATGLDLAYRLKALNYNPFLEYGDVIGLENVIAGTGISIDYTDPLNPIISATGSGTGDMLKSTYDPNTVEADTFDTDNFTAPTTAKTTPVDADLLTLWDSVASFVSKRLTWANLKSTLKTYFDTLYKDEALSFACSDEDTDLAVATDVLTFRMPFAMTLTDVRASVKTAPTGSVITVDINQSGSTILTDRIEIDAGEKTSTTATNPPIILTPSLTDDAEITIDIDTIGSTVAGTGLKVTLIGSRT